MKLYPLSVGPIVGAVSETSIRLWGRGQKTINWTRRLEGQLILEITSKDNCQNTIYKTAPLQEKLDYTGVIECEGLKPDSEYIYKMGWVKSSLSNPALSDSHALSQLEWRRLNAYCTTTASQEPSAPRSFAFGSCRYMLRLPKTPMFLGKGSGDKTFKKLLKEHQGNPIHRFLMLGDQIYADDFSVLFPDRREHEFNLRYRHAFSSKHLRKVMAQIPTAMMWDDHEIQNNWPKKNKGLDQWPLTDMGKTINEKRDQTYRAAEQTFFNYQFRHSPALGLQSSDQPCTSYWYQFQDGCCDFFVTDTRSARKLSGDESQKQIMSDRQMDALKAWLDNGNDLVKIVASSTLIFPDAAKPNEDQWSGFRRQQFDLLDFIRKRQIRKVLFISGDVHASFASQLTYLKDPDFKIISIISSPFFWPYAHHTENNFQLSGPLEHSDYYVTDSTPVMSEANFTRVTVSPHQVHLQIIPGSPDKLFRAKTPILAKSYSF